MDVVMKTIDDALCVACGVNADLLQWLNNGIRHTEVREAIFRKDVITLDDIVFALGHRNAGDRRLKCADIITKLWDSYPELGPCPPLKALIDLEDERRFYLEYREHTAHQFLTFLLGLFIYDTSDPIRSAVIGEVQNDKEEGEGDIGENDAKKSFMLRWFIAASMHDIGYLRECAHTDDIDPKNAGWKKLCSELDTIWQHPLSHTYWFMKGEKIDVDNVEIDRTLNDVLSLAKPTIKKSREFFDRDVSLAFMNTQARCCGLVKKDLSDAVREVYKFIHEKPPVDENGETYRPRFYDHGITSAIIILKLWDSYQKRISSVAANNGKTAMQIESFSRRTRGFLKEQYAMLAKTSKAVQAACSAIALHNIRLEEYRHEEDILRDEFNTTSSGLEFSLHGKSKESYKSLPLAFLLRLTDEMQDWERPKMRQRRQDDHEKEITDGKISIKNVNGRIGLWYAEDRGISAGEPDTSFPAYQRVMNNLLQYLDKDSVKKVVTLNREMKAELSVAAGWPMLFSAQEFALADTTLPKEPSISPDNATDEPAGGEGPRDRGRSENNSFEIDKVAQAKIKIYTGKDPANEAKEVFVCEDPSIGDLCSVRWNAMLALAELDRCMESHGETTAFLQKLNQLKDIIDRISKRDYSSNDDDEADSMLFFLERAVEELFTWGDGVNRPSYRDKLSPKERLEKFLTHRTLTLEYLSTYSSSLPNNLEYLLNEVRNSKEESFSVRLRELKKSSEFRRSASILNSLIEHLQVILKTRSEDTHKEIRKVLQNPKGDLRDMFPMLNSVYPHLGDREYLRIWGDKEI